MPLVPAVAIACAGLIAVFVAVWFVQLQTRNAGIVDAAWAASLGAVALLAAAAGTGNAAGRAFVALGGGIWGLRLGYHLWRRTQGRPEDPRYRALRDAWGAAAPRRMLAFFMLQAAVSMALSTAFFVPAYQSAPPAAAARVAAIAIWLSAVAGEAAADRQLRRFRADPARRDDVCDTGWWRYSRHPNYFFECVPWCAYAVWSLGGTLGWLTLAPPILMGWLLMRVSGIPALEAHLLQSRPGYRDYIRRTSRLMPWPPRPLPPDPGHRSGETPS